MVWLFRFSARERIEPSAFRQERAGMTRGFALVEMLVALGIIAFITAIVVFNHQDFSESVKLSNQTENISVDVRRAQVEGLAVEQFSRSDDPFQAGRGIYVNLKEPKQYVYFADRREQGVHFLYDAANESYTYNCDDASNEECITVERLRNDFVIQRLCGIEEDGDEVCTCSDASEHCDESEDNFSPFAEKVRALHLSYVRPRPNANIVFVTEGADFPGVGNPFGDGGFPGQGLAGGGGDDDACSPTSDPDSGCLTDFAAARIYVEAPSGRERYVQIRHTGQINIGGSFSSD